MGTRRNGVRWLMLRVSRSGSRCASRSLRSNRKWLRAGSGPAALTAIVLLAGCSSSTPNEPTTPANANVAGRWVTADGSYQWTLTQSGTAVTGSGSGPNANPAGTPISGTLTGSVAGDTFTFSEERTWSIDGITQTERVHADAMRVTTDSMTGQMTFLPLFPPYRPISPTVTMVRRR